MLLALNLRWLFWEQVGDMRVVVAADIGQWLVLVYGRDRIRLFHTLRNCVARCHRVGLPMIDGHYRHPERCVSWHVGNYWTDYGRLLRLVLFVSSCFVAIGLVSSGSLSVLSKK